MGIDYNDLPYGQRGTAEYLTSTQQPRIVTATLLRPQASDPSHVVCRLEIGRDLFIQLRCGQLVSFELHHNQRTESA